MNRNSQKLPKVMESWKFESWCVTNRKNRKTLNFSIFAILSNWKTADRTETAFSLS